MKTLTEKLKNNHSAWIRVAEIYEKSGDMKSAMETADSALKHMPDDTLLIKLKKKLLQLDIKKNYDTLYDKAMKQFEAKKYAEAVRIFSEYLLKVPDHIQALEFRAFTYSYLQNSQKSNTDLNRLFELGVEKARYHNLRGANYHNLGNDTQACSDFRKAMEMGDGNGRNNFDKICGKGRK